MDCPEHFICYTCWERTCIRMSHYWATCQKCGRVRSLSDREVEKNNINPGPGELI